MCPYNITAALIDQALGSHLEIWVIPLILGHIPPAYSPIYRSTIGSYAGVDDYINKFVPSSFTTPLTAAAARVHAPLRSDNADNPWIQILGHGLYNSHVSLSLHSELWGGVTVDT